MKQWQAGVSTGTLIALFLAFPFYKRLLQFFYFSFLNIFQLLILNEHRLESRLVSSCLTDVGASWVIINLSEGAYGSTWMAHHPVLHEINLKPDPACVRPPPFCGNGWDGNCQTAPTPSNSTDFFKEMTDAFHVKGLRVIVYVASQGPAMFKHGTSKAFDVFRRNTNFPLRTTCTETPANVGPKDCFANPDNCCSHSI